MRVGLALIDNWRYGHRRVPLLSEHSAKTLRLKLMLEGPF
jgi:hypothetical protein